MFGVGQPGVIACTVPNVARMGGDGLSLHPASPVTKPGVVGAHGLTEGLQGGLERVEGLDDLLVVVLGGAHLVGQGAEGAQPFRLAGAVGFAAGGLGAELGEVAELAGTGDLVGGDVVVPVQDARLQGGDELAGLGGLGLGALHGSLVEGFHGAGFFNVHVRVQSVSG